MNPAPNLILVGPTGAGKTAIGRRLAGRLGLRFVDLDQLIEAQSGARIPLIFEVEGEPGFRRRESAALAEVCAGEGQLLATGAGAVLDPDNRRVMRERGFVVHLHTSVDQQLRRLERDRSRPLLLAPDREERLRAMAALRGPLYAELAHLRFCSDGLSVPVAADRLMRLLQKTWRHEETA